MFKIVQKSIVKTFHGVKAGFIDFSCLQTAYYVEIFKIFLSLLFLNNADLSLLYIIITYGVPPIP